MKPQKKRMFVGVATALMALPVAPALFAQQGVLEEITVTARKREESMQDVGLAVSALGQTDLDRQFVRDLQDLANISPNTIIDDTNQGPGGVAAIYIRGVGVADVEKNFDPAVGVVVDGVFIGANAGSLLRGIDLARVEILRGPQGTLFGRNTVGGTINIERTRPTGELGGRVRAGVENYDTYYLDGILNVGITDTLAAKFSAATRDQREGYYDNDFLGGDQGAVDYQSYGANFLWEPTDNLEFEYTYQTEETDQDMPVLLNTGQSRHVFCQGYGYCSPSTDKPISGDRRENLAAGGAPPPPPNALETNVTPVSAIEPNDLGATFDADTHILQAGWSVNDDFRFDYIYGSWESEETIISDWDGTPELLYGTTRPADYEQQSHELRLTYDAGEALSFVLGAYYWESEYEIRMRSWIGFATPGVIVDIPQTTQQETESKAIFFEGDYRLTDQLVLTLGGRYTEDEKLSKQFGAVYTVNDQFSSHPSAKWDEFTPKVGMRYHIDDDTMVYGTYSIGYRAGGFNGRVASVEEARQPYDPETLENYEVGLKSQFMDNRLRFNAAAFYMKYEDKQEELQLPSASGTGQKTVVVNPSTATIQGLELELQAYLSENLNVRANLGYLDSGYDDFVFVDSEGSVTDFSDLEFRRAPDLTGTLDATYEFDVAGGQAWVRGSYRYLGEHETSFTNVEELSNDTQHLFDLSLNYSINNLQFSLFGRNLTDEDGYTHGYDVAGLWSYAATRSPRTYGLEVMYNFGD